MRVLYIHSVDPNIVAGGTDLRVQQLCDRLRRYVDIEVMSVLHRGGRWRRVNRGVGGALRGIPPRFTQLASRPPSMRVPVESYDRLILGTHFATPMIPSRLRARCVLDAHNVESAVVAQLAVSHPNATRRFAYRSTLGWSRRYEAQLVRDVLGVWAVSEQERDVFAGLGAKHVAVVANGAASTVHEDAPTTRPIVVFVGSLDALFNVQGVEWFVQTVWPSVRARVPGAVLRIVGRGGETFNGVPGVDALGYVEDLAEAYADARVAIVPLKNGAGTRLKIAEALARGVPVVTTSVGVEGYGAATRGVTQIADSPADFATGCIELLVNDALWMRTRSAGGVVAHAELTWDAAAQTAARSLSEWCL